MSLAGSPELNQDSSELFGGGFLQYLCGHSLVSRNELMWLKHLELEGLWEALTL